MRDRVNLRAWRGGLQAAVLFAVADVWLGSGPEALLDPAKRKTLLSRLVFFAVAGALTYMLRNERPTAAHVHACPGDAATSRDCTCACGYYLGPHTPPSIPRPPTPGLLLVALSLLSLPTLARAEEPADGVFGEITHETMTGSGVVLTDAGNRTPNFTAREELRYRVGRLQLAVRLDGSAEKAGVDLAEPGTVTTIEAYALGSYRVIGPVAIAGVWGITRPSIGVPGPARETWMAGALVGTRERWVLIGAGVRRVVGDDVSAMAAWRLKVNGKASAVGDVVGIVHGGRLVYQARAGVAVSIAGKP